MEILLISIGCHSQSIFSVHGHHPAKSLVVYYVQFAQTRRTPPALTELPGQQVSLSFVFGFFIFLAILYIIAILFKLFNIPRD